MHFDQNMHVWMEMSCYFLVSTVKQNCNVMQTKNVNNNLYLYKIYDKLHTDKLDKALTSYF